MLHAIIMAGGEGTRFWPASRAEVPKQLLDLAGGGTMIQQTVARLDGLVPPDRTLVVTNRRLVARIIEQIPRLPAGAVLGEPCKRDTAPCVGLSAGWVRRNDPEATMVVMPADHMIQTNAQLHAAIHFAARLVEQQPERLITFGIRPAYPAESFGYIERGEPLEPDSVSPGDPPAHHVRQFHEKPPAEVARKYVQAGNYLWNSGIFVWKARTILDELQRNEPAMVSRLSKIVAAIATPDFDDVFTREFEAIQGRSIDYAVMEQARNVLVIEAPFTWDDAGSWQAIARLRGADDADNTVVGKHLGVDTTGTIVRGSQDHLIVTLGLSDCIVVHTPDATLVANKHDEESIRRVVQLLREKGWDEYL